MNPDHLEGLKESLRDERVAVKLLDAIRDTTAGMGPIRLMEVCGTHTAVIRRAGIPSLLPEGLELISGPGCPVCVTPNATLDLAMALARLEGVTVTSFGDMLRVPGSHSSLTRERAAGADVRVVYSPMDALEFARRSPDREVVFLGIGFETTAPTVAAVVQEAIREVPNFSVLVAHKLVPPALHALCDSPGFAVDGFLCPGHVSSIIGADAYGPIALERSTACVVAGFEPVDVLLAVLMLVRQIAAGQAEVEVEYRVAVRAEGNPTAQRLLGRVFQVVDSEWRGLGVIPASGLALRPEFERLDASRRFDVQVAPPVERPGCLCGQVLAGAIRPTECGLFGRECTPADPVGPCMVSSEGTCAAYFKYGEGG